MSFKVSSPSEKKEVRREGERGPLHGYGLWFHCSSSFLFALSQRNRSRKYCRTPGRHSHFQPGPGLPRPPFLDTPSAPWQTLWHQGIEASCKAWSCGEDARLARLAQRVQGERAAALGLWSRGGAKWAGSFCYEGSGDGEQGLRPRRVSPPTAAALYLIDLQFFP